LQTPTGIIHRSELIISRSFLALSLSLSARAQFPPATDTRAALEAPESCCCTLYRYAGIMVIFLSPSFLGTEKILFVAVVVWMWDT
jgi:hypothetical protein